MGTTDYIWAFGLLLVVFSALRTIKRQSEIIQEYRKHNRMLTERLAHIGRDRSPLR